MRGKSVWAVIYTHRYGVDVWVAEDEESVRERALSLIQEFRDDFHIPQEVTDQEALEDWAGHTGGLEFIEITLARVLPKRLRFTDKDVPPPEENHLPSPEALEEYEEYYAGDIMDEYYRKEYERTQGADE